MKSLTIFLIFIFILIGGGILPIYGQEKFFPEEETYPFAGRFSLRLGVGYSFSILNFDTDNEGSLLGQAANVVNDDIDEQGSFGMSMGIKYCLLDFLAIGVNLDYNITDIKDIEFQAESASAAVVTSGDLGEIHTLSGFVFGELKGDLTPMFPYFQGGVGINGHFADFAKNMDIDDEITFGFFLAAGAEFLLSDLTEYSNVHQQNLFTLFFEVRWHYSLPADFTYEPIKNNSKFTGDFTIIDISLLVGLNFYFGGAKEKESEEEEYSSQLF